MRKVWPGGASGHERLSGRSHESIQILLPSRDGPQQPHPPELALETSLSKNVHRVNSHAQDNHPSHKNSNEPTKGCAAHRLSKCIDSFAGSS